ncbi:hypothetical protein B9K03_12225, partial [Rothia sp. Olga]
MDSTIIKNHDYKELVDTKVHPSLDYLKEYATKLKQTVLPASEYNGLVTMKEHPSLEFLEDHA